MKFEELSQVSSYVSERIRIDEVNLDNYVSTENMISERGGVTKATKLPSGKTISVFQKGDILISNIRPYFKKIWLADKSGGCSNDVLVVRANEKISNRFLYYVLSSDNFFDYAVGTSKGTKMPRGDKKAIMKYKVPIYSLVEQEKIAEILRAFDKKIILNKQINHHLVEQAYAIYKEVCVNQKDDSFVEETIKSISQKVITGKTPSTQNKDYYGGDLPFITIPDMHNNIYCVETLRYLTQKGEQTQPSKTLPKNSIIVSCIATPGLVSLLDRESQTNQQINAVIPSENQEYYLFLELLSKSKLIIELGSSGSTTYNLNKTQFEKIKISAPSIEKRYELNNLLRPLFLKINQTQHETIKLSQLRDTLLPKLLSGEISVNQTTK
ncbi:restriction endonuclease subunit S [Streptococcus sanguinis]|uniref:restriction endonuclease subunit S n=1 Tax=Streptococcus sanguinis TaxID=1305 RepID=UPI0002EAE9A7|nr:restriction endonuclease subunit S [Streptococcus sanguinis]